MIEKYKQYGLTGLFLSGIGYGFKQTAKLFSNLAELASTKVPLSPIEKKLLIKNHIFKNTNKGHRCFVIGNGPSLNKQDLSLLSNEITIVVNAFWKNNIVGKWQPTYYCFTDPILFNGSIQAKDFFRNLQQKINSSIFLAPIFAKNIIENQKLLPPEKVYYVVNRGKLSESLNYNIDLTKSIPGVINVIELGIMWAIYMGFSQIYLIGLDHSWLSHKGTDKYFYRDTIENSSKVHYEHILKCVLELWRGYETILKIASNKNINIINATEGGFLDVFERVNYESIFHNTEK